MADDERRAEIEAVARALASYYDGDSDEWENWKVGAAEVLAALDRVRDARGGDEAVPEAARMAAAKALVDLGYGLPAAIITELLRAARPHLLRRARDARDDECALCGLNVSVGVHCPEDGCPYPRTSAGQVDDDRVRDARDDDEGPTITEGEFWTGFRSPQGENHEVPCPRCDGSGREGGNTMPTSRVCSLCHGTGKQATRSPQSEDYDT